jgi:hypothetical protein
MTASDETMPVIKHPAMSMPVHLCRIFGVETKSLRLFIMHGGEEGCRENAGIRNMALLCAFIMKPKGGPHKQPLCHHFM